MNEPVRMHATDHGLQPDPDHWTVKEALRFLPGQHALSRGDLSKLGKDCAMVSRIRSVPFTKRPTPQESWPHENAYAMDVLSEVFDKNPSTQLAYRAMRAAQEAK